MNGSLHKKIYLPKNKRSQRLPPSADPISNGIKACILAKVDQIYDHIQALHHRSSFLKTCVSTKNSMYSQRMGPFSDRPSSLSVNNMTRTSFSSTMGKSKSGSKKEEVLQVCTGKSEVFNLIQRGSWRRPTSQSQIREMLKKRTLLEKQQNKNILRNPYYKIMKRRVKTSVEPDDDFPTQIHIENDNQLLNQDENEKILRMKTEIIKDKDQNEEDHMMKSHYSVNNGIRHKKPTVEADGEHVGIRQKSQTKIYEQIKKYFEQKYGAERAQNRH